MYRIRPLTRRAFLGGLAALPEFGSGAQAQQNSAPPSLLFRREPPPITSAEQVLNVMEFEPLARSALPPAHYGYLATGVDDDLTVVLNHEAFGHYEIRARRFADLSHFDPSRTVFGVPWPSPLYLSAVSAMRAFHPEGEAAVARAAHARATQMMLASGASASLEEVRGALGTAPWQQLYPTDDWAVTLAVVQRAETAGCPAIVLTVDSSVPHRNNEMLARATLADNRPCGACHKNNSHDMWLKAPLFAGLDVSRVSALAPPDLTLGWFDRLRAQVKGKLMVKGIVT
ncbi:MAG TPA: alpha-hydroxy acid oxidase, partial [Steroidobacteraceae bacterium]|nr:alpha-hydroxy acid oxidase [Steroidobacteraceae bacterium]